jgi:hypothetical protein
VPEETVPDTNQPIVDTSLFEKRFDNIRETEDTPRFQMQLMEALKEENGAPICGIPKQVLQLLNDNDLNLNLR